MDGTRSSSQPIHKRIVRGCRGAPSSSRLRTSSSDTLVGDEQRTEPQEAGQKSKSLPSETKHKQVRQIVLGHSPQKKRRHKSTYLRCAGLVVVVVHDATVAREIVLASLGARLTLVALHCQRDRSAKQQNAEHDIASELPQVQVGKVSALNAQDVADHQDDQVDKGERADHDHLFSLSQLVVALHGRSRGEGDQDEQLPIKRKASSRQQSLSPS